MKNYTFTPEGYSSFAELWNHKEFLSHKIKPPVQAFYESLVTVDTDVFNRWNAPKPADSNVTHQTETLHKQKVPSGFKLLTGWLTDKAKNPDSQNRETTSFKSIKQSFSWISFNIALGFQQKRFW